MQWYYKQYKLQKYSVKKIINKSIAIKQIELYTCLVNTKGGWTDWPQSQVWLKY